MWDRKMENGMVRHGWRPMIGGRGDDCLNGLLTRDFGGPEPEKFRGLFWMQDGLIQAREFPGSGIRRRRNRGGVPGIDNLPINQVAGTFQGVVNSGVSRNAQQQSSNISRAD
jgi:hypothetical protein